MDHRDIKDQIDRMIWSKPADNTWYQLEKHIRIVTNEVDCEEDNSFPTLPHFRVIVFNEYE